MPTRGQVTLGILAGGQARRLGGMDKAFVKFQGQSLLARTVTALGSGFAETLVSYNVHNYDGSEPQFAASGTRVVPDLREGFLGPLAGLESLLRATQGEWLLTAPVDLREIPDQLANALLLAVVDDPKHGVVTRDADGLQPLVALWPVRPSRAAVSAALDAGERAAYRVLETLQFKIHDISPSRLGNLNTPTDFE